MRNVDYSEDARAEIRSAAAAHGVNAEDLDGYLTAISHDIAKQIDSLTLRPPDHPERRIYMQQVEGLGAVLAICELDGAEDVVVLRVEVGAFRSKPH